MSVTITPRYFKMFSPSEGGDVIWRDIGDPIELQDGEPVGGEALECRYKNPDSSVGIKKFYVGHGMFLENNANNSPITQIPDDQLLACVSMAAILAGEVHPGTKEFFAQIASDQNNKNFQTILGDCKLKTVTLVDESELGAGEQSGLQYDIEFQRVGQSGNTKTVRSDVTNISKYANRSNSFALSSCCAGAAVTEEFGKLTPEELGIEGSQIRANIEIFLKDQRFYA